MAKKENKTVKKKFVTSLNEDLATRLDNLAQTLSLTRNSLVSYMLADSIMTKEKQISLMDNESVAKLLKEVMKDS